MKSTERLTADILCRAEETQKKNALRRRRCGTALGALVLVAALSVGVWQITLHRQPAVPDDPTGLQTTLEPTIGVPPERWVEIPKEEIKLPPPGALASWAYAFVVYQGSTYCGYSASIDLSQAEENHLLGEKLGTTIGTDNESYWAEHPKAYTLEHASNIGSGCEIYSVNGYDPSFRLAVIKNYTEYTGENHEEVSGTVVYMLDKLNGITLRYGWDLFTDRLHLRERMVSAISQSHDDWNNGIQQFYQMDTVTPEQWNAFFNALDNALFEDTHETNPDLSKSSGQKHLTFTLSDSLTVYLRLYADGHVSLNDSRYMVKIAGDAFDAIYRACK